MSNSETSIKELIKYDNSPDSPEQLICLQILLDSVDYMEKLSEKSPSKHLWRVNVLSSKQARLVVAGGRSGQGHRVCTVEINSGDVNRINRVWFALCQRSLKHKPGLAEQLDKSDRWEWGPLKKTDQGYSEPPSRNGYFYIENNIETIEFFQTIVKPLHHDYLARSPRYKLTRKKDAESPELLEYLKKLTPLALEPQFSEASDFESETPFAIDINEAPNGPKRVETKVYRILRDTKLATEIKQLYEYNCQLCDTSLQFPNGQKYAEAHHIKPLGEPHNGPDEKENIICVCPNCHAQLDYVAIKLDIQKISQHEDHKIKPEYINYHNEQHREKYE